MSFNPLNEKGTPLDKQVRNWSTLNVQPLKAHSADPYTRTRVILMNGIECEAAIFGHQMARHTSDPQIKEKLAAARRVEQQQQKMVNWLLPGQESALEVTIGYEQVAVDLTAYLARTVTDKYVKAALDFALLEDFDHLYRYANLYEMREKKQAEKIVGSYTEIFPGRATILEHCHPLDSVRKPIDAKKADIITKLHILTIIAAEQQTMNYYMNVGPLFKDELSRGLYLEIAQIEEQHVSHYESLNDPTMSWFEMLTMHEYHECYMYWSCMQSESDSRLKKIWEQHLMDEIEHLHMAIEMQKKYEGRDMSEELGEFPQPTIFEPNKEYVRKVCAEQIDHTASGTKYVTMDKAPKTYHWYQEQVNGGEYVPSQKVIEDHIQDFGEDYRLETEGPHPVQRLRKREVVTV